jgi:hypothetical protein
MIIYKKMNDIILRTQNYYAAMDPEHYYKTSSGTALDGKATRAKKHKDVYLSDLLNNQNCFVSFSAYRDTDNASADVKISLKNGIVRSYNPETNLLAIECVKKRPSRISALFKRTNKMRYVEPELITVSSVWHSESKVQSQSQRRQSESKVQSQRRHSESKVQSQRWQERQETHPKALSH